MNFNLVENTQSSSISHKKALSHSRFNRTNLIENQGRKINYDSFIYVDRLTNNKIVLG